MLYVRRNNGSDWLTNWFNDGFLDGELMRPAVATAPAVNVKEDVKTYTMEMAVPGIKKEFCRVSINADGNLEIAIENKLEHKEESKEEHKEHYLRREFNYSNYQQTYELPDDIVKEEITAKVENGVLTVTMPKVINKEDEKKVQRQIEVG